MSDSVSASERERFLTGYLESAVSAYERGDLGLGRLVVQVENAVEELSNFADRAWVEKLGATWFDLEIVYAGMLDEGRSQLTDDEREIIKKANSKLRSLLAGRRPT